MVTTSLEATHKNGDTAALHWLRCWRGRDDQQLVKPGPSEHVDPLEECIASSTKRKIVTPATNVVSTIFPRRRLFARPAV